MKVLISGAHFTPALAVIEEFKKRPDVEVIYVGRSTTMEDSNIPSVESKVVPSLGVKFIPITTGRLQIAFTPYTILSLLRIPVGFIQAAIIILSKKPDVILSFGGYVALPIVSVGWLFSIPIIIHEQTLVAGLSNKIGSIFADKIAISFKETGKFFNKEKTVLSGNPIRKSILKGNLTHRSGGPTILVMGGSQGSHVINLAVEEGFPQLIKIAKVIHITGDNKFGDFERLKKLQNENYQVFRWIDGDFASTLAKADLVVSRAGINTLTELAYLGKPALIIPIPYLYSNEQLANAKYFAKLGLVKILPQWKLSATTLVQQIKYLMASLDNLKEKAKEAKKVIIKDAAKRVALEIMLLHKTV